jgi:hypothetical protein
MRSPLGYPPLIGPAQSNDRRASEGGLARLIESSRDVMTSENWHETDESAGLLFGLW